MSAGKKWRQKTGIGFVRFETHVLVHLLVGTHHLNGTTLTAELARKGLIE
jgi:hypothetical protein